MEDLSGQGPDEVNIVTDEDDRAGELLERGDQRINAGHVQMRGGLVHQEQVGRVQQEFHERQPALFTTAEHAHLLEHVVAAEEEAAQHGADVLLGHALRRVAGLVQHGALFIEHLDAILRVVTRLHVVPEQPLAGTGREHAGQELEQGALARTIGADQNDALIAFGLEVHPAIDGFVAVAEMHVLERDHLQPAALGLRKAEAHGGGGRLGGLDLLHALDLLELGLRL